MPKSIVIEPEKAFAPGAIHFTDIPVNAYHKTIDEELAIYSRDEFLEIWRQMCAIREFETILHQLKTTGAYKGTTYNHAGPAHLSIGQEAAAVGMAFSLTPDDHIFGSHRSHGEILAKAFSAIRQLSDDQLTAIMTGYRDGAVLRPVEGGHQGSIKELAARFFVYGAYSELFARETGFNRGLGGSMHAFFTPFGIYPNNAIVGGSGSIAPGAALYKLVNRKRGIVVANIGDASFACGPVWEGIVFSAMDQFRTLWDPSLGGGLPIVFHCMNNFYGMGGQPFGETMGMQFIARIGAGVNPEQMHAERINGYDPIAVIEAFRRKREILERGDGPVLLDTVTYRFSGHSPSDASSYRSKEELEHWQKVDSIPAFRKKLAKSGLFSARELDAAKESTESMVVFEMFKMASDLSVSPRIAMDSEMIGSLMFSNQHIEKLADTEPEILPDIEKSPRVVQIRGKIRTATVDGKPVPKMKMFNVRDAIFEAILHRFTIDPTLVAFGEENRDWGGSFAVYRGLTECLPYHRLFNSPISEAAIVGAAVGYAMEGGRAIVELMYADFVERAGDELFNQLSKWQAMSAGRDPYAGGRPHLGGREIWRATLAGLDWAAASYSRFEGGISGYALRRKRHDERRAGGNRSVIFLESQKIYDFGEIFQAQGVPDNYYEID